MRAWIVCVTYICLTLTEASGSLLPHFINKQAPVVTFSWWHQRNCGSLAQGSMTPLHTHVGFSRVLDLRRRWREDIVVNWYIDRFVCDGFVLWDRGNMNASVRKLIVRMVNFFGSFSRTRYYIFSYWKLQISVKSQWRQFSCGNVTSVYANLIRDR